MVGKYFSIFNSVYLTYSLAFLFDLWCVLVCVQQNSERKRYFRVLSLAYIGGSSNMLIRKNNQQYSMLLFLEAASILVLLRIFSS